MDTLAFSPDMFGGVIVEPEGLPEDAGEFERLLDGSLETWKSEGFRLVWLDVPASERSALINDGQKPECKNCSEQSKPRD